MSIIDWNCSGLGSTSVVRILANEVRARDPLLVFLAETKASVSRIKGIKSKLDFTQGIVVPSDGRSDRLALLWKEGANVSFKSCSNSHIDVVVREDSSSRPWRATGFYSQLETEKRFISWQLLETLSSQCDMPWIVLGDFNEIMHPFEKSSGSEREVKQMEGFKVCLEQCGLTDFGFVG